MASLQHPFLHQLAASNHLKGQSTQAPNIKQQILLLVDKIGPFQLANILNVIKSTKELMMLFWLIFPYENCMELRQVIAVKTSHTFDPISCQFKGSFFESIYSAMVSPARNSSIRQRNSVSQKYPKHLTIKLWLISMFLIQNLIYSQSYFYLANTAFLYPFITNKARVFLWMATIYRYSSSYFTLLRILKSSIVGVLWLILFLMNEGAYLHFLSSGFVIFFVFLLSSKKLLSFGVLTTFTRSLLLFRGARYLRTKGRGLKVVRRLCTDMLCETTADLFSFYLKLVTESTGCFMASVKDLSPLTDHLISSCGSFLLLY